MELFLTDWFTFHVAGMRGNVVLFLLLFCMKGIVAWSRCYGHGVDPVVGAICV